MLRRGGRFISQQHNSQKDWTSLSLKHNPLAIVYEYTHFAKLFSNV